MTVISKSALKPKMLEHFRRVEQTGEELIVTDNNRPVLRVTVIRKRLSTAEQFADVRARGVKYHGDVLEPTTTEWTET